MFFQADNLQSSAVRSLKLNPATNQAIVEYVTSAKSFLYENIDADAIVDFFFGEIESTFLPIQHIGICSQQVTNSKVFGIVHKTI